MLWDAPGALPVASEVREGYSRTLFRHWIDADGDRCDTRREVLIAEAVEPSTVGAGCTITGGAWTSYYDSLRVTDASTLDIDHMVPLAEAWDSGAYDWNAAQREAFANDLDAPASLVAVTARTNRSKGDQDPADWLPPSAAARCQYLTEWLTTKLCWGLAADQAERDTLTDLVGGCPNEDEPSGLDERAGRWGVRLLVRRVKPSCRDAAQLTALETSTGWKFPLVIATDHSQRVASQPAESRSRTSSAGLVNARTLSSRARRSSRATP